MPDVDTLYVLWNFSKKSFILILSIYTKTVHLFFSGVFRGIEM